MGASVEEGGGLSKEKGRLSKKGGVVRGRRVRLGERIQTTTQDQKVMPEGGW